MSANKGDLRLLLFGSLKGGVGKTTASLMAVEALVRLDAEREPSKRSKGVVLIDADIVGTEAASVVGTEFKTLKLALCDVVARVSTDRSTGAWLAQRLRSVKGSKRYLIRSFPSQMLTGDVRRWRTILEQSGLFIQRRIADLVEACHTAELDVVVDLPAFDVGFATQVRDGLRRLSPLVSYVTDTDVRSLRSTIDHLELLNRDTGVPPTLKVEPPRPDKSRRPVGWQDEKKEVAVERVRVVVNRAPSNSVTRMELAERLKQLLSPGLSPLAIPELDDVTMATRVAEAGGRGGQLGVTRSPKQGSALSEAVGGLVDSVGFRQLLDPSVPTRLAGAKRKTKRRSKKRGLLR